MNKTLQRCILLSGLFALSATFAPSSSATPICCIAHYSEQGDAGDEHAPQPTGVTITAADPVDILVIAGTLGNSDTTDAFSFQVGAPLDLTLNAFIGDSAAITIELWNAADLTSNLAVSSGTGGASVGPITLLPGTYIVEMELFGTDPDYTIEVSASPPSAVPEPASLCLFGLGLAGLSLSRRRLITPIQNTPCR